MVRSSTTLMFFKKHARFGIKNYFMPKKVILFPEIGRVKFFLSLTRPQVECVSEYIFLISKTNKQAKKNTKKQKKLKKKR